MVPVAVPRVYHLVSVCILLDFRHAVKQQSHAAEKSLRRLHTVDTIHVHNVVYRNNLIKAIMYSLYLVKFLSCYMCNGANFRFLLPLLAKKDNILFCRRSLF